MKFKKSANPNADFYDDDDEGFELDVPLNDDDRHEDDKEDLTLDARLDEILEPPVKKSLFSRTLPPTSAPPPPTPTSSPSNPTTTTIDSKSKKVRNAKPPTPDILTDAGNELYLDLPTVEAQLKSLSPTDTDAPADTDVPAAASTWSSLGIHPSLPPSLPPTPLQSQVQAIPSILARQNTVISSHTGSGKTFAFLLPILSNLIATPPSGLSPYALVVTPGRELCSQIQAVLNSLTKDITTDAGEQNIPSLLAIGGTSYQSTVEKLRKIKPRIIVATPGRLGELLSKSAVKIHALNYLVLDEFDNLLLSTAHKESTEGIVEVVRRANKDVTVVLASATAKDMREGQIKRFLGEDYKQCEVKVSRSTTAPPPPLFTPLTTTCSPRVLRRFTGPRFCVRPTP